MLHLVGQLLVQISDARNHKHKMRLTYFMHSFLAPTVCFILQRVLLVILSNQMGGRLTDGLPKLGEVLRCDIYLLKLGFHPLTVVSKLVQKWKRDSYIQKKKQYTKQYKNTKYTK